MEGATQQTIPSPHALLKEIPGDSPIALLFHLSIAAPDDYRAWLAEDLAPFHARRLHRVALDPVAHKGMRRDEVLIQEYASAADVRAFMDDRGTALARCCRHLEVLALAPEPALTFRIVRLVSRLVQLFRGVKDPAVPETGWRANNPEAWPDDDQMEVARAQPLEAPLYVYNLNRYRPRARYSDGDRGLSGRQAYDRYAKIAGFELLRRGAFPVYGGRPLGLVMGDPASPLGQRWDHFIFVRYPRRRQLLAILERPEFHRGQAHRDAGLESALTWMGSENGKR